jgi:phosphoribosylglycinamide formyltransferase 1
VDAGCVVLASGAGSLFRAITESPLGIPVRALITDIPDCGAVAIANTAGIPVSVVDVADYSTRAAWNDALIAAVNQHAPALVVSAGFMRILGPAFVNEYRGKIINTHPALLPQFPGAHAVRDALNAGAVVTGCTIHFIDEGVDTGPVIIQQAVEIEPNETEEHLHERIKAVERELLPKIINQILTSAP